MNRRDFLLRLGGAAAAVALSPLLDLAPIIEAPSSFSRDYGMMFHGMRVAAESGWHRNAIYYIGRQWIGVNEGDGWRSISAPIDQTS